MGHEWWIQAQALRRMKRELARVVTHLEHFRWGTVLARCVRVVGWGSPTGGMHS